MATRNKSRRGRSRKRRRAAAPVARIGEAEAGKDAGASAPRAGTAGAAGKSRPRASRRAGRYSDPLTAGERPQAPWHPLPLSELLILIGAIGVIIGLRRGVSNGAPALIAGIVAVAIGTVEVTLREHMSGFRSHTVLLALLPTLAFHSIVVLSVAAVAHAPLALNAGLLAVDLVLFTFLFKLLRARFLDARRERVLAGRR
jgi:hypothetical protein